MTIKGYACHWNKPNGNHEIVTPESFTKVLQEVQEGKKIPINFNHNDDIILGSITNFYRDDVGLYIVANLNEEVSYVRDYVQPLIVDGTLDCFSTEGWIPRDMIYRNADNTYLAKEFNLTAVAIVTNPADTAARFTQNSQNLHCFNGYEEVTTEKRQVNKYLHIL